MKSHVHPVQVYYEDTDHSGVVYHANYLKYFERAREHLLWVDELVALWRDEGIGFVVFQCKLKSREGARFGDKLEVRTTRVGYLRLPWWASANEMRRQAPAQA